MTGPMLGSDVDLGFQRRDFLESVRAGRDGAIRLKSAMKFASAIVKHLLKHV